MLTLIPARFTAWVARTASAISVPATKRPETRRPIAERSAKLRRERFSERRTKNVLSMRRVLTCACSSRNFSTSMAAMQPARGGDGLAIAAVLHVAAGEDAVHAGEDVVVGFEVAVARRYRAGPRTFSRWVSWPMPRNSALVGKSHDLARLHVAQLEAGDFLVVDDRKRLRRRCRAGTESSGSSARAPA